MKRPSILTACHEALAGVVDTAAWSSGDLLVRRGFFYRHGEDAASFAQRVVTTLAAARLVGYFNEPLTPRLVDCGEVDKPFRGGASVAQNSHFWARVALDRSPE